MRGAVRNRGIINCLLRVRVMILRLFFIIQSLIATVSLLFLASSSYFLHGGLRLFLCLLISPINIFFLCVLVNPIVVFCSSLVCIFVLAKLSSTMWANSFKDCRPNFLNLGRGMFSYYKFQGSCFEKRVYLSLSSSAILWAEIFTFISGFRLYNLPCPIRGVNFIPKTLYKVVGGGGVGGPIFLNGFFFCIVYSLSFFPMLSARLFLLSSNCMNVQQGDLKLMVHSWT